MAALTIIRFLFRLKDVDPTAIADGRVLVARVDGSQPSGFIHQYEAQGGGGGGAPANADYLVGTADATLTNEIVVGVTPGGELGGTWAAPTVDAVHSGSSHAQTQAAAEATAAAALAAHVLTDVMDGDAAGGVLSGTYPNPGFAVDMATQAELDAHINDPTDAHAGTAIGNTPAGGIAATTVQAAINELDTEKANVANAVMDGDAAGGVLSGTYPNPGFAVDMATQAELDAVAASAVLDGDAAGGVLSGTYPNPGFAADMATQAELDAHINDPTDAHAGTAIGNTPAGGIAATTVQGAINELDSEKVSTATFDDHSARHENGGADEISVAGLSGELADAQPVTVRKNTGADVGTRSRLNFIEGSNVTLTVADDAGSDEVDITIASTGGGGSGSKAYPIQLLNPRTSTLAGNSFFSVLALTDWDAGHWEFVLDVEGKIYGVVRVPPSYVSGGTIRLAIAANATTGVTRLVVATAAVADGESLNPGALTDETAQDITVPATAYLREDVTFTLTPTLAADDLLLVEIFHDGDHANDTLAVNTLLFGAWLEVTA